jgi:hypothetical protein
MNRGLRQRLQGGALLRLAGADRPTPETGRPLFLLLDVPTAERLFLNVLELTPDCIPALARLGELYVRQGRVEAGDVQRQIVTLDPNILAATQEPVMALFARGKSSQDEISARNAIRLVSPVHGAAGLRDRVIRAGMRRRAYRPRENHAIAATTFRLVQRDIGAHEKGIQTLIGGHLRRAAHADRDRNCAARRLDGRARDSRPQALPDVPSLGRCRRGQKHRKLLPADAG